MDEADLNKMEEELGLKEGALNQIREWQQTYKDMKSRCDQMQKERQAQALQRRGSTGALDRRMSAREARGSLSRGRTSVLRSFEPANMMVEEPDSMHAMDGARDLDGNPINLARNGKESKVLTQLEEISGVSQLNQKADAEPKGVKIMSPRTTEEEAKPSYNTKISFEEDPDDDKDPMDCPPLPLPHRSEWNVEYEEDADDLVEHTSTTRAQAIFVAFLSVAMVIIMCVWSSEGLLGASHVGHVHSTKTRVGHVHSPLFMADHNGVSISLHGTQKDVFDIRLITMASKDFGKHEEVKKGGGGGGHRLLASTNDTDLTERPAFTGTLTYSLMADGVAFFTDSVALADCKEIEYFKTVDVQELGYHEAEHYTAEVKSETSDGKPVAFLFQTLRMGVNARWRVALGLTIFIVTFTSIVAEKIHRSYSAFMGSAACLALLCAIQETPHLPTITGMIDFGTLMLLFSMMILMHMLASTGFFNWFALKVVKVSKQKPKTVFFLLTNICGWMSMVLDNVTVVLLTGPLTFQIATKTGMGPRALYLSMTICATIGGTATLIGDPPNIVIGSKMQVGFANFLMVNLPITGLVLLPLSSLFLWMRLKDEVIADSESAAPLDYKTLEKYNCIKNEPHFENLGAVLLGILVALLTAPVHGIEPSWFTMMGMMACAMMFDRHHMGHFLEFVEWDTLFFFAILFVLVETLSELGVIRAIGDMIVEFIKVAPEDNRMYFAIFVVLWLSSMGSAFLESLPFTTTFVYILLDLMNRGIPGVQVELLVWPLSIGACVGGIGSIMGSSANLVCMAVSNRYAGKDEDKIQGSDFLKYGFPTLIVSMVFSTIYLFFLFQWIGFEPPPPGTMATMC